MKLYQPRHVPPEGGPKITETPPTPVDKTDETPSTPGFGGFVNAPLGGSEDFWDADSQAGGVEKTSKHPQPPADKTGETPYLHLGARVEAPARDPDPTGCPTHWQRVPELPPKGQRAGMVDGDGHGRLYRFKLGGRWWLVKFLPPFDGRLSLTGVDGRTRVFTGLEEAAGFLAWLESLARA